MAEEEQATASALTLSPGPAFIRYKQRRDFPFDHTAHALLTLFDVLTLEGWLDVRDMLRRTGEDNHRAYYVCLKTHAYYMSQTHVYYASNPC